MQEINTAILESHFAVEQSHLPDHPLDVQLYVGEMALIVLCNDQFLESHPYHRKFHTQSSSGHPWFIDLL